MDTGPRTRQVIRVVIPLVAAFGVLLAWNGSGYAGHDIGQDCYTCHNIQSGQVWPGSYSVYSGKSFGMSSYSRPITCEVCHTNYGTGRFTSSSASHHPDEAFRHPRYQQVVLNLVAKGFFVLAMDPVGQGERLQYYDPGVRRSLVGGPTAEHSYLGRQCFLTGASAARYFTWDGIRAIDYLVSRPEVDPSRHRCDRHLRRWYADGLCSRDGREGRSSRTELLYHEPPPAS